MRVLVIDTALEVCAAGVFEERSVGVWSCLSSVVEPMARGHQERIGPLVRDVVSGSGGFDTLDRIGVTVGPGSFTGLRVGLAFALGLGAALDRPVVGLSTLDGLAASVEPAGRVVAAIDARRGQVYLRGFLDGAPDGEPAPMDIEVAREGLASLSGPVHVVGSGGPHIAPDGASLVDLQSADLEALARLTAAADPAESPARPLYLRAPDATPPTRLPGQARVRPVEA